MRLAGAVERSILERRSVDYLESALKKLTLALNNLRDDAVSIEDKESPVSAAEPPAGSADAAADAAQVDELRGLLETHNLEAVDRFAALSPNLRQMLDPLCFANLDEAIDNLDFQRGADVLRVALRNLGLVPPEPSVAV
jgi:hypothetical protein